MASELNEGMMPDTDFATSLCFCFAKPTACASLRAKAAAWEGCEQRVPLDCSFDHDRNRDPQTMPAVVQCPLMLQKRAVSQAT